MSEIQASQHVQIEANAALFGKFSAQLQKATDIFIVSGPQKAGKSVTIDLFTDKVLQVNENDDESKKWVSEQHNYQVNYDPIYYQFLAQSKTLVIEGFTLSQQKNKTKLNLLKSIFFKTCLTSNKRVSLLVVVDSLQRQQQENLHILLDHMFECLNIYDEGIIKELRKHFYLLLTKTEEQDAVDEFNNICGDVAQSAESESVKEIIISFQKDHKVQAFPNDTPSEGLGKKLRQQFKPIEITKKALQFISKNRLNQDLLRLIQIQKPQIIETFTHLLNLVSSLAKSLVQKAPNQKQFLSIAKKLNKQLSKNELRLQNLMKTSWQGLKKGKSTRQQIQKQKGLKAIQLLIEYIFSILRQLQAKASVKEGYQCLIGTLKFIKELFRCLDDKQINDLLAKFMEISRSCQKFYVGQNAKKQENLQGRKSIQGSKQKVVKKPAQKKPLNKAANAFKQEILGLSNNEEVIKFCIAKIKQKESADNFEVNDVIYHLKFLRELLESYDTNPYAENRYFIEQLLELYAFNENIYEFQKNVEKYVQKKDIPMSAVQRLIIKADQIKSYESSIRLINYAISNTYHDEQYRFFNKMKSLIRLKQHEQYLARSENRQTPNPEKKQYNLLNSLFDEIKRKAENAWLQSESFKRLLQSSQE